MKTCYHFREVMSYATSEMYHRGREVVTETWQGAPAIDPNLNTIELQDFQFRYLMPNDPDDANDTIKPDQPWADAHFEERMSGIPMNPGTAYREWPWHTADPDLFLDGELKFDISYMERLWTVMPGLRFPTGTLDMLVQLLVREPFTRKAYLPLFWPEDTGRDGRTMCSLGYHFMRREDRLYLWYDMRSCDLVRHFANDIYFAVRTAQRVLSYLEEAEESWGDVKLGTLYFSAHSLHYLKGDEHHYRQLHTKYQRSSVPADSPAPGQS